MPRPANPWMTLSWDAYRLGLESCAVIALRMGKVSRGGAAAQAEAQRMVAEKVVALVDSQLEVARLVARGQGADAPGRLLAGYQRKVSANRRRLTSKR